MVEPRIKWSSKEDECIAKAGKTVSMKAITSVNQNTEHYWKRVKRQRPMSANSLIPTSIRSTWSMVRKPWPTTRKLSNNFVANGMGFKRRSRLAPRAAPILSVR